MILRIYFYKKSKTLFGKLIRLQQRKQGLPERYAGYSHVEICFSYDAKFKKAYSGIIGIRNKENVDKYGLSFSSSETDGGTRFKAIEWDPQNWDYIDVDVTREEYLEALIFCRRENGNRYGIVGIFFAQILNFYKKKKGTWFCSEIVTRALQEIPILCPLNSLFTKPGELAMELEKKGYLLKS